MLIQNPNRSDIYSPKEIEVDLFDLLEGYIDAKMRGDISNEVDLGSLLKAVFEKIETKMEK